MGDVPVCKFEDTGNEHNDDSGGYPEDSVYSQQREQSVAGTDFEFSYSEFCQIIAKTVTFSFLKNKCGTNTVNLIPSIAVNTNGVQIHLYDSENDVLLQSGFFELLLPEPGKGIKILNSIAVIVIWMTLNYKLFCTGVFDSMERSGFHKLIDLKSFRKDVKAPCNVMNQTDQKWVLDKTWALQTRGTTR